MIKIYRTVILPVLLCGCNAWSLTLREEQRLRVFENRVLRKLFGPKKDEMTGVENNMQQEALCFALLTKHHLSDQKICMYTII